MCHHHHHHHKHYGNYKDIESILDRLDKLEENKKFESTGININGEPTYTNSSSLVGKTIVSCSGTLIDKTLSGTSNSITDPITWSSPITFPKISIDIPLVERIDKEVDNYNKLPDSLKIYKKNNHPIHNSEETKEIHYSDHLEGFQDSVLNTHRKSDLEQALKRNQEAIKDLMEVNRRIINNLIKRSSGDNKL